MRHISGIAKKNLRGRSIEDREKDILKRDAFGHWEMDTVVGSQGGKKDCLLVLTDMNIFSRFRTKRKKALFPFLIR